MLFGMIARPRATSSRTNSGVITFRDRRAEVLAAMLLREERHQAVAALVLADRDELHLRRDDAAARVVHLRHVHAGLRAARLALQIEAQRRELGIGEALLPVARSRAVELFGVVALLDPARAQRRGRPERISIFASGRYTAPTCRRRKSADFFGAHRRGRVRLRDLAHRHADVRARAFDINLARIGQRLHGGFVDVRRGIQKLGIGVHDCAPWNGHRETQVRTAAPRFPTTALPVSGSEGLSHPAAYAPRGPLRETPTLIELWDNFKLRQPLFRRYQRIQR